MSKRVRFVACVLLALGAGITAYVRALPLGPYLDIVRTLLIPAPTGNTYQVDMTVRGGEPVDALQIEGLGDVLIMGNREFPLLASGTRARTGVYVPVVDGELVEGGVRVRMLGRVEKVYEVWVTGERSHERLEGLR